jgi:hypothetical protein
MSGSPSQRWAFVGGFAVAAAYAVVALVELFASDNAVAAIPFAYVAVCIAGPLAVVARFVGPARADEQDGESPGGGPGPSGGGGDDPSAPPWWPDFAHDFWAYVDAPRPGVPVGAHDRATPES